MKVNIGLELLQIDNYMLDIKSLIELFRKYESDLIDGLHDKLTGIRLRCR